MEVTLLKPYGYCFGVVRAIEMAKKIKKEHPDTSVSILGMLVHNQWVIDELTKENIFTYEVKEENYQATLEKIPSGYVIFTAHGHDAKLDSIATNRGLIPIDATCPQVKTNLAFIKKALDEGRDVIYIGKKKHPETIAALSLSSRIYLYDTKDGFIGKTPTFLKHPLVFNQTTLSILELYHIYETLKKEFTDIEIQDEICNATRLRQEKLLSLDASYDLLFIIGDPHSNNTESLYLLAKQTYPSLSIYKISSIEEMDETWLEGKKKIAVTSGASTPPYIVEKIVSYLKQYEKTLK